MKIIQTSLIWILLVFISCSTKTTKVFALNILNFDTTYIASTQQLKSNSIPDSVFQMANLLHLGINGMDCDYGDRINCWMLKDIPPQIKNLKKLKSLRLTLNAITTLPPELSELKNLVLIDLTDNTSLSYIDNIVKIQSLKYLYLYGCGLKRLPMDIGSLKNLKELGLVGNNFDKSELSRIKKALPNCSIIF